MTPAARVGSAIEALELIEETGRPADAVLGGFFRARRHIGASDRKAVAERVFGVLRRRARLDWHLARRGAEPTARTRMLARLLLVDRLQEPGAVFGRGKYAPAPLDPEELDLFMALAGEPLEPPEMPASVRAECPAWAENGLRESLSGAFAEEMKALAEPAPVDLRVNALKTTRREARRLLFQDGIRAEPVADAPWALRCEGRPALGRTRAFREGLVEVQDAGSQRIAHAVAAEPGMQVVDFCAGAGGKALALAADMQGKGRIVATDVHDKRLARLGERMRRAGAHNIERRLLESERDRWVRRQRGKFDRVLVDAPCTGTGSWRRNPDARWTRDGPGLAELIALQDRILESAARLVKPGGRLVYATCSLLGDENEARVARFLETAPDFARAEDDLRISPARDGSDGFYAAILEREEAPCANDSAT